MAISTTQATIPGLIVKMMADSFRLGPVTNFYMFSAALPYTFSGIAASGARAVIAGVDRGQQALVAQQTATMVKLGFVDTVAAITSAVVQADHPDAVAKVSIEMMLAAELDALTRITQKMVEQGNIRDAMTISEAMRQHGHDEFLQMVASDKLPAPVAAAKEKLDSAVNWVTGGGGGTGKDGEQKGSASAECKEGEADAAAEQEGKQESDAGNPGTQTEPSQLSAASIA